MPTIDPATELASKFTVSDYIGLRSQLKDEDPGAWKTVLDAMRRRLNERILLPIAELEQHDETPREQRPTRAGFAIMAMDCLLIDTLQSFKEGRASSGEGQPAKSFTNFFKSEAFSTLDKTARFHFFSDVRNALLHNGETRGDWKIRVTGDKVVNTGDSGTRIINRRLFHRAVVREFENLFDSLSTEGSPLREKFLRRMDALAGMDEMTEYYFAYGSNLLESECRRDAPNATEVGRAFLPGYRLQFTKHSASRNGDAATIVPDEAGFVWGFVYRVTMADVAGLVAREQGYDQLKTFAYVADDLSHPAKPLRVLTFSATQSCSDRCGPASAYLDLIVHGAILRNLPGNYVEWLKSFGPAQSKTPAEPAP